MTVDSLFGYLCGLDISVSQESKQRYHDRTIGVFIRPKERNFILFTVIWCRTYGNGPER